MGKEIIYTQKQEIIETRSFAFTEKDYQDVIEYYEDEIDWYTKLVERAKASESRGFYSVEDLKYNLLRAKVIHDFLKGLSWDDVFNEMKSVIEGNNPKIYSPLLQHSQGSYQTTLCDLLEQHIIQLNNEFGRVENVDYGDTIDSSYCVKEDN